MSAFSLFSLARLGKVGIRHTVRITTPRMMAAIMTKTTPQNKRPRETFFFTLRLTVQSSYPKS